MDKSGSAGPAAGSRSTGTHGSGVRRGRASCRDFLPQRLETRVQRLGSSAPGARARTHDQIDGGNFALVQPEGLANDAANAVARDPAARHPYGHRQPQARRVQLIVHHCHAEKSVTQAPAARVRGVEIVFTPQATLRRQSEPPSHRAPDLNEDLGVAELRCKCRARATAKALGYQLAAALGAAPRQHPAAGLSGHACTEPVGALAAHFARLVGTLHTVGSVERFVATKKGGKAKPLSAKVSI